MITLFLIWFIGALIVAVLLQGHLEWLEHNYELRTNGENDLGFIAACCFSVVSLVIILVGIWIDYQEHPNSPEEPYRFPWKFPLGRHYAEIPVHRKLFWFPILTIMVVSIAWYIYGERFPLYVPLLFAGSIVTAFCYLLTAKDWLYRLSTALGISGCLLPLIQMFINHNFHFQ